MFILETIPIQKKEGVTTLSYWSATRVTEGCVVEAPLKNKKIKAVVISVSPANYLRTEIRKAGFQLKKARPVSAKRVLSEAYLNAVRKTALYFASSEGVVLSQILPAKLMKEMCKTDFKNSNNENRSINSSQLENKLKVITGHELNRVNEICQIAQKYRAKGKSVHVILPTNEEVEAMKKLITNKIVVDNFSVALHFALSQSNWRLVMEKIKRASEPLIIISTSAFLSISSQNTGAVILEKENSRFYVKETYSKIDLRFFVEQFTKNIGADFILSGNILRTETYYRMVEKGKMQFGDLIDRKKQIAERMIDMRKKREGGKFEIFSDQLKDIIQKISDGEKSKMVMIAGRKGFAGMTACGDCGEILTCEKCLSPLILFKAGVKTKYLCGRCGKNFSSEIRCRICQSWKLTPLGIGTQKVKEELDKTFKKIKTFSLDSSSAKTPKLARQIVEEFKKTPKSILIGTEMVLSYLKTPIDYGVIISLDSLLSLPRLNSREKVLEIISTLKNISKKEIMIQTRNPNDDVINFQALNNLNTFYENELSLRKTLEYPPFKTLIKILATGKNRNILENLISESNNYKSEFFESPFKNRSGENVFCLIFQIPNTLWPDEKMIRKLQNFGYKIKKEVNPDNLLF